MKELITSIFIVFLCFNVNANATCTRSLSIEIPKETTDRPLKVTQYADEDLLELAIDGTDIKSILILNEKGAIVGNIENISPRMAISTLSWSPGNYTMLYTLDNTSYREEIVLR